MTPTENKDSRKEAAGRSASLEPLSDSKAIAAAGTSVPAYGFVFTLGNEEDYKSENGIVGALTCFFARAQWTSGSLLLSSPLLLPRRDTWDF